MYRCILADPPWKYGDKLRMGDVKRSAEDQYAAVMTTDDICKLAVNGPEHCCGASGYGLMPDDYCPACGNSDQPKERPWLSVMQRRVDPDAVLWLWTTNPFLLNGDACRVCRAWGFEPKQLWTWIKGDVRDEAIVGALGMGHYMRVDTEHMVLATRGKATQLVQFHNLRNYTIVAPKSRHSEKPDQAYELVEQLTPGPRLELFARQRRDGWDAIGNELV